MIGEFALVMSVKEKNAVILAAGGRFMQVKNRDFQVGQRILIEPSLLSVQDRVWFAAERFKGKLHRLADRLKYKGLILLSCVSVLVPTSAYAATKYVPWTYVSMDTGNVSIQYQLNARGEVLSAETLSDDAKAALESITPVRYEKVEDAIDRALSVIYPEDAPEGEEKEPVLIGISSRFGNGEKTVNTIAENIEQTRPVEISVEHLDWPETHSAREEMLSIGQYGRKKDVPEMFEPDTHAEPAAFPAMPGEEGTAPEPMDGKEPSPANRLFPDLSQPDGTGKGAEPGENPPSGIDRNAGDIPREEDLSTQPPQESGADPNVPAAALQQNERKPSEDSAPEVPDKPDGIPAPDRPQGSFSAPPSGPENIDEFSSPDYGQSPFSEGQESGNQSSEKLLPSGTHDPGVEKKSPLFK